LLDKKDSTNTANPPLAKVGAAGFLMGLANLIPGVSGGTMILAMGLYSEFIDSVAEVSSFRFNRRRLVFLAVVGGCALVSIACLARGILYLLFSYDVVMYSLFIGLTLGGAPALFQALRPISWSGLTATAAGIGLMVLIVVAKSYFAIPHNTGIDLLSGLVGATTMVLPGISGSYMLLIMDQYDRVIGSIRDHDVRIILPVGIGAIAGIISLSNVLKMLLRRFHKPTIGFLLGMLFGSVLGLWPFGVQPSKKTLADRSHGDLVRLAERKGIDLSPETPADPKALAALIFQRWDQRDRSGDLSPASITTAVICVLAGFATTTALSRSRKPSP